jgi:predicted ester cyclase
MGYSMSHDLKALSRKWFEEVWNKRRLSAVPELSHPDAIAWGLSADGQSIGFDSFLPFHKRFIDTFPDFHITVDDVIEEGDKTVVRLTATGTHTGHAMGISPTGRPIRMTGMILIRWKDGKIIEGWNEFDAWGMMQQLTAAPTMYVK